MGPKSRAPMCFTALALLAMFVDASPEPLKIPEPANKDTCPVCGMFVAKYPEWIASVVYKDGHAHHFDGAKDMFKYLLNLSKWAPEHRLENIVTIGVTEYYGLTRIGAHDAWYVVGSDVLGPMGNELIPLATRDDAEEFLQDHRGKRILVFEAVTPELLDNLDKGKLDQLRE